MAVATKGAERMNKLHFSQPNSSDERFHKTLSYLIVLFLVITIFYTVTFAWFGEVKVADTPPFIVSDLDLDVQINNTNQTSYNLSSVKIEPGKTYDNTQTEIKTSLVYDDQSNLLPSINAFIKVQILTTPNINSGAEQILQPVFSNPSNWVKDANDWYYYLGYINNTSFVEFSLQASRNLTINEMGLSFTVSLSIEAIQADYLNFTDPEFTNSSWNNAPAAWKTYASTIYGA